MFDIFKLAWIELASNKSRSLLTALGIIIGVFAVTLIIASGDIANKYITGFLLDSVGDTKLVRVDPFASFGLSDTILTEDDYDFVLQQEEFLPYSKVTAEYVVIDSIKNYKEEKINQQITGATPNYSNIFFNNFKKIEGRFFNEFEYSSASRVAFVSRAFTKNVMGRSSLLGNKIEVLGVELTVIGEYDGISDLFSTAEQVYVPLPTLWDIDSSSYNELIGINVVANNESQVRFVADILKETLNKYRSEQFTGNRAEEINIRVAQQALDTVSSILQALQVFLSLIGVISLLVGGIGITNVMLMSVTQRIREIGIRKALGATTRDILSIFLAESILLTVISGIVGAGLAQYFVYVALLGLNTFVSGFNIGFVYSWNSLYLSFIISIIIGVLFGIYPAIKAGKLSIVEALRYD